MAALRGEDIARGKSDRHDMTDHQRIRHRVTDRKRPDTAIVVLRDPGERLVEHLVRAPVFQRHPVGRPPMHEIRQAFDQGVGGEHLAASSSTSAASPSAARVWLAAWRALEVQARRHHRRAGEVRPQSVQPLNGCGVGRPLRDGPRQHDRERFAAGQREGGGRSPPEALLRQLSR